MSSPFINPYEVKDVAATSLNNLDKQSQDVIAYLDGFFASQTTKDREIVYDCRINIILPVPLLLNKQNGAFDIDDTLVDEGLDYLHYSRRSIPSKD